MSADLRLYPEPKNVFWIHCWQVRKGRIIRFWRDTEEEARQCVAECLAVGDVVTKVLSPDGADLTKSWGVG